MKPLVLVLFAGTCGCGSGGMDAHVDGGADAASACPSNLASACPSPAPTWTSQVLPIYQSACISCHQAEGQAFDTPLDTYQNAYARRSGTIDQVYSCFMPPAGTGRLTLKQRDVILDWLLCGAPEH